MFVEPYERMYKQMEVEPRRKGKHFTQDERAKIEALHKAGLTHQAIADIIGCCRSAITRELKKRTGRAPRLQNVDSQQSL